eukprot:5712936-Amphidinium_carterae.4
MATAPALLHCSPNPILTTEKKSGKEVDLPSAPTGVHRKTAIKELDNHFKCDLRHVQLTMRRQMVCDWDALVCSLRHTHCLASTAACDETHDRERSGKTCPAEIAVLLNYCVTCFLRWALLVVPSASQEVLFTGSQACAWARIRQML